jgi:ankyrin repeat protein
MGVATSVCKPSVHDKLLLVAASGNDASHHRKVVELLALGAVVNTVDRSLCTPLHRAAHSGHVDVCVLLIHAKANLQLCDKQGRTPLQIAQTQAHALLPYVGGHEQVKKLLQKVDDDGELIAEAAKNGNLRQIRGCVQGTAPGVTKLICLQRGIKETPKKATLSEESSAPRRLWETNAELSRTATATALSTAPNHPGVTKLICPHQGGCAAQAINWANSEARTPLHFAAEHGHVDVVEYLLKVHADVNDEEKRSQFTPLHWAAIRGHSDVVQKLVEFKADIAAQDMRRDSMRREAYSKGLTALHWAAIRGHTGVIDTLLEANAGIDMRDSQKQTPLHRAVVFGPTTAVLHLIQCKADVNASDCYQRYVCVFVRAYIHTCI